MSLPLSSLPSDDSVVARLSRRPIRSIQFVCVVVQLIRSVACSSLRVAPQIVCPGSCGDDVAFAHCQCTCDDVNGTELTTWVDSLISTLTTDDAVLADDAAFTNGASTTDVLEVMAKETSVAHADDLASERLDWLVTRPVVWLFSARRAFAARSDLRALRAARRPPAAAVRRDARGRVDDGARLLVRRGRAPLGLP